MGYNRTRIEEIEQVTSKAYNLDNFLTRSCIMYNNCWAKIPKIENAIYKLLEEIGVRNLLGLAP